MVTILPALRQVREDLVRILDRDTVERLCRQLGYRWRSRRLDPWTTLHLFILQVLNNNTAMTHLPHLSGERFTASAYCQARQRLPLKLLQQLVNQFGQQLDHPGASPLWHGHRVLLEDGSGFSMPDTAELQAYFGQPGNQKPGCGFPVAHLLTLFAAQAGFLRDVMVYPLRTQDIAHAAELHPQLTAGDIIVGTALVSRNGGPPGRVQLIVRSAVALISFLACGAGYLWSLVDGKRRAWHDLLLFTIVVRRRGLSESAAAGRVPAYSAVVRRNDKT